MSPWDRRQVLHTLLGAAALPLTGCGGAARRTRTPPGRAEEAEPRIRSAADELISSYTEVSVLVRTVDSAIAEHGADERRLDRNQRRRLRLRARNGDRWREVWSHDVSADGIARAVDEMRRLLGNGRSRGVGQRAIDRGRETEPTLAALPDEALTAVSDRLFSALMTLPSSRLIRRRARLESVERHDLFIDAEVERRQRYLHNRLTASVVAWTGAAPGAASTAVGSARLSRLAISAERLTEIESWALALLTAREVPRGESKLVLSPAVSALLFGGCLAPCLDGSDWPDGDAALADESNRDLGWRQLTIIDDPRGRHYGSLHFDDDGRIAEPATLVSAGTITGGLGRRARARRERHPGRWTGTPTRMRVRPGEASVQDLMKQVGDGILIEGPIAASVDPRTLDFSVRASRGLGLARGTLSGRLYGSLAVRGNLLELLRSGLGLSSQPVTLPLGGGERSLRPFEVSAPALATTGLVEPG